MVVSTTNSCWMFAILVHLKVFPKCHPLHFPVIRTSTRSSTSSFLKSGRHKETNVIAHSIFSEKGTCAFCLFYMINHCTLLKLCVLQLYHLFRTVSTFELGNLASKLLYSEVLWYYPSHSGINSNKIFILCHINI